MATIRIQNIGAIANVEIELNKVNVIMGEQSSGKSTIAKLISYCQWVEKRRLLDGEYKESVQKQLLDFHHLGGSYFSKNSLFEYESEFLKITYKGENLKETIKVDENKILEYAKTKNIYIPAERNFVSVIPNLGRYNETNDNIMNLIYDWFSAKTNFTKKNPLSILNFDIDYYFQKGSELDVLILKKADKEIPLSTGSSGLQSLTPLIVLLEYLTQKIFEEEMSLSVKEKEYSEKLRNKNELYGIEKMVKFIMKHNHYNSTKFIIEEPEQNLFPETQRDLIYYILEKLNSECEHSLLITTHSPYILYALNNCMLGGLVNSQLEGTEKEDFLSNNFLSQKSWLNPKFVSVWEIENGTLRTVQDKDGIISANYFDQKMTELMNEYDQILTYYKDEE